ncbi:MAG: hydroxyacylglutathione hydrolase [Proteobacteria bacterium]|nr:hydroxyacylglutathione hydrolase [Pseudomonadota bacterium]MDE3207698.1 hydroxyacylglutathione hydrolase [Pseudomonadota bacterium]
MLTIIPVPAFMDNYIWMLTRNGYAVAIDPGDAQVVIDWLEKTGHQLSAILNTHHHQDHTGGNAKLQERFQIPIYGPANDPIPALTRKLKEGDSLGLDEISLTLRVIDIPGHTLGHIGYIGDNFVFCGDTLFAAGCGRVFEGTPAMMLASLDKLASLPNATKVYCAHEYTLSNLQFALQIEPQNQDLQLFNKQSEILRKQNLPTIPTTIETEKKINPFLRCRAQNVATTAHKLYAANVHDPVSVFSSLREAKNSF